MKKEKNEAPIKFEYIDDESEEETNNNDDSEEDEEFDDEEEDDDAGLEIANKNYEGVEIIESVVDNKFIDLMINALRELKKSESAIEIDLDEDTTLRLHHEESIDRLNEDDVEEE